MVIELKCLQYNHQQVAGCCSAMKATLPARLRPSMWIDMGLALSIQNLTMLCNIVHAWPYGITWMKMLCHLPCAAMACALAACMQRSPKRLTL